MLDTYTIEARINGRMNGRPMFRWNVTRDRDGFTIAACRTYRAAAREARRRLNYDLRRLDQWIQMPHTVSQPTQPNA
jgi:hypothetical protein